MNLRGCMESLNPELALYSRKNECTRTNTVLHPISEVSTGAVSLWGSPEGSLVGQDAYLVASNDSVSMTDPENRLK